MDEFKTVLMCNPQSADPYAVRLDLRDNGFYYVVLEWRDTVWDGFVSPRYQTITPALELQMAANCFFEAVRQAFRGELDSYKEEQLKAKEMAEETLKLMGIDD